MLGATGPLPLKGKARVGDCHRKDRRGLPPSRRPPSVGFADSSPGGGAKDWDLIRRFAPPVRLTMPEKHFRLTLILVFFDRCGKGVSPSYPRRLG